MTVRDAAAPSASVTARDTAVPATSSDGDKSVRALVLSSGGCDSTTCIGLAVREFGKKNVASVSIRYGQRHDRELKSAQAVADYYGIEHRELDLAGTHIWDGSACPLLADAPDTIEHDSYAEQVSRDSRGMAHTYVPFRNGLFLSAAAACAMSVWPGQKVDLLIGTHGDEAAGNAYADCSLEFTDAIAEAISVGTYGLVNLRAPFLDTDKTGVVKLGLELKVPFELTWSCYEGGAVQCGTCATCRDRKAAFHNNGVEDPVPYAE